jgi:hypothetical protein
MKVFQCGNCSHPLYFENIRCEKCGHICGYRAEDRMMLTFDPANQTLLSDRESIAYKFCQNHEHEVCNWVIPIESADMFCSACKLNRTIPNLGNAKNYEKWQHLEVTKHSLIYQLQKLGLPLPSKLKNKKEGLCFDFVSRLTNKKLMTGHANGVITILISEANSVERERRRKDLSEPYRTLIGHLRHEVGHYFWERIIYTDQKVLDEYRSIFGDERISYADSLTEYYKKPDTKEWQANFISRYATAHSWEDWAETWAHYLHIMDMVETAFFFKLKVVLDKEIKTKVSVDPYTVKSFDKIVQTSVPLSFAVNSISRAMGHLEVYPFVLTPAIIDKLKFIHKLLWRLRTTNEINPILNN